MRKLTKELSLLLLWSAYSILHFRPARFETTHADALTIHEKALLENLGKVKLHLDKMSKSMEMHHMKPMNATSAQNVTQDSMANNGSEKHMEDLKKQTATYVTACVENLNTIRKKSAELVQKYQKCEKVSSDLDKQLKASHKDIISAKKSLDEAVAGKIDIMKKLEDYSKIAQSGAEHQYIISVEQIRDKMIGSILILRAFTLWVSRQYTPMYLAAKTQVQQHYYKLTPDTLQQILAQGSMRVKSLQASLDHTLKAYYRLSAELIENNLNHNVTIEPIKQFAQVQSTRLLTKIDQHIDTLITQLTQVSPEVAPIIPSKPADRYVFILMIIIILSFMMTVSLKLVIFMIRLLYRIMKKILLSPFYLSLYLISSKSTAGNPKKLKMMNTAPISQIPHIEAKSSKKRK